MADDKDNNEYILIKILIFFRRLIHDQQNGKRDEKRRNNQRYTDKALADYRSANNGCLTISLLSADTD